MNSFFSVKSQKERNIGKKEKMTERERRDEKKETLQKENGRKRNSQK